MKGVAAIVALLVLSAVAPPTHAAEGEEPTPAQVRAAAQAFDRGREAYKNEEFADAAGQFEGADSNAPSAAALELAMRSRDKAGQLDRAASLAALALRRYPDDGNIQKHAPDLIKRARQELFELSVTCDSPCQLTLDGKIVHGAAALEHTLFLTPGEHTLRAGFTDDRTSSRQVQASAAESGELAFEAPAEPEPEAASAPEPEPKSVAPPRADSGVKKKGSGWSPVVFYVGAGLTAVAGAVTVWSGLDTQNNPGPDKVKEGCVGQGESCPLYQDGLAKEFRTNVLIGVTAGLGVGTILIGALATNWSGSADEEAEQAKKERRLALAPWVAIGDGALLGAEGRF
jgi:hypothetical protein